MADSTKFGHQSLAHLARSNDVQHLVVDDEITAEWRKKIVAAGIKLHVAEPSAPPQRQPDSHADHPPTITHDRQRSITAHDSIQRAGRRDAFETAASSTTMSITAQAIDRERSNGSSAKSWRASCRASRRAEAGGQHFGPALSI